MLSDAEVLAKTVIQVCQSLPAIGQALRDRTTKVTTANVSPVSRPSTQTGTGFEQPRFSPGNTLVCHKCGAEYSAVDDDLARLVQVWPNLSADIKAKIISIVANSQRRPFAAPTA